MGRLEKDSAKQMMTFGGMSLHSGNPIIDSLAGMLFNPMGLMASPGRGQSVLDAQNIKFRSRDQMDLMRYGMGNSLLGQHIGGAGGLNMNNPLVGIAAQMAGMSGVMDMDIPMAFNGGNPMKAIMGMKANSTGMTMGMGFGKITDADNASVKAAFKAMQNTLFKTRTITGKDMDSLIDRTSSDIMKDMSPETREAMASYITKGADGKDSFDFKKYQAEGSGRDLLHKNFQSRQTGLQDSLKGTDLSSIGLDSNNIDQAKFDAIKSKTEGFTKKLTSGMSEAALKALKEADTKTERLQTQRLDLINSIAEVDPSDKAITDFRGQIGEQVATGVNSKYMRGYSQDQMSQAWNMSQDLGLASLSWKDRTSDDPMSDKMAKSSAAFARNAGGALRAVSDLTGAEDAGKAMEDLNSLLGNSAANLGTEQGAQEVENLVRRFKASARTAGVGIDAVMTILDEVKALSAAHPQLQNSGGIGAMETSIKSLNTTGALTSAMGGDWVRKMGGSAELSRQVTETLTRNKVEPVVSKSKGLVGHVTSSNLSDEDKKKALDLIENFGKGELDGKKHNFNNDDWGRLYEQIGKITGDSGSHLHEAANSEVSRLAGQMYADEHKERDFDQGAVHATGKEFELAASLAIDNDHMQVQGKDGKIMTPEQRKKALYEDLKNRAKTGEHVSTILSRYKLSGNGRLHRMTSDKHFMTNLNMDLMQQDPLYRRQYEISKEVTEKYAEDEAEMGKQFSSLNQAFNQTLIQEVLNGGFGDGAQGILDSISDDPTRTRVKSMLDAVQFNGQNKTPEAFKAAMLETMGGAEGLDGKTILKNLELQGRGDEASKVSKQRKALMEKGGLEHFSLIADKLTLGQLYGINKDNYTASKAAELGIPLADIERATKFGRDSGIINNGTLKRYANSNFSEVMKGLPVQEAVTQAAQMAYEGVHRKAADMATSKLEANMQGLADTEYSDKATPETKATAQKQLLDQLKLYHDAGYISLKDNKKGVTLNNIDWKGSRSGIGNMLDDMSTDKMSEGLSAHLTGLKDPNKLNKDEQAELLKFGGATRGVDGKLIVDEAGLKKLQAKQKAIGAAEASPNGSIKKYADMLTDAATKKDQGLATAQKDIDMEVLKEVGSAFSNGSEKIVSGLGKIVEALKGAL